MASILNWIKAILITIGVGIIGFIIYFGGLITSGIIVISSVSLIVYCGIKEYNKVNKPD